jgi:predicted transposase YbfD/YdcC
MTSKSILEYFKDMPDPREDNRRHLLIDIIFIVICASLCGADKWDDIEAFGKAKESWFRRFITLPHGIPSHDTMARVFSRLVPDQINRRFIAWVQALRSEQTQEIVNIDGKCVRRSHDKAHGKSAIHMVSAWANKAGLILGQQRVDEKSNEITAIPELLELLELEGCVVTIDAMGTQTEIAKKIIESKADYVLALKGNQSTLKDDVELYFEDLPEKKNDDADYYRSVNKDHGRIEIRECWTTSNIDWIESREKWMGLKSICAIRSTRIIGEQETQETRYYISSLDLGARQMGKMIRAHWGVENSLHWVLDMVFREDECRKRKDNSAENFAIIRHITLNLLKQEKTCKRSIAGKRLLAGWDESYLDKVLFNA